MEINVRKIFKGIKANGPEILTGVSVAATITSNILTYRATKKETEDHDKKHYILPAVVAGVGVSATIASNRLSATQKASIIASATALAAINKKQREEMNKRMTPEEMAAFDGVSEEEIKRFNESVEGHDSGRTLYYIPKYGIRFYAKPIDVNRAEAYADKFFSGEGEVGLDDILEFLKAYSDVNAIASQSIRWYYNFDSEKEQHIIFDIKDSVYNGIHCKSLDIIQIGMSPYCGVDYDPV